MVTNLITNVLDLDVSKYVRGSKQAVGATDEISQSAGKLNSAYEKATGGLGKFAAGAVAAFSVRQAVKFGNDTVNAFSNLNESANAVNVTFGNSADVILAYGENAATSVGLAASEFNQLATNTGALLNNFGFTQDQVAEQTVGLTERAADMASVFNTDVGSALEAINSGLRNETEPLRRFGVSLDDATIRAKAVELGLAATTAQVDKQGKAQAALALIYEQTDAVAGDFTRTSGELANQQRILAAEFENAKAEIGEELAPVAAEIVSQFREMLPAFTDAAKGAASLVAAAGPLIRILANGLGPALEIATTATRGLSFVTESIIGIWDEAAAKSADLTLAIDKQGQKIQDGVDGAVAFADSLVYLAGEGSLTAEAIESLGRGVEFVGQQQAVALREARDYAVAQGAAADQVELLEDALYAEVSALIAAGEASEDLVGELGLQAAKTRAAEDASDDLGGELKEQAGQHDAAASAADRQTRSLQELADELAAAADPVFRAVDAYTDYAETLRQVDEDGARTAEEQLELAEAAIGAQQALAGLGESELRQGISAIATALGVSTDEAREFLRELGLIDGKQVTTVIETRFTTRRDTREFDRDPESGRTFGGGRAGGGRVSPNEWYLVGENRVPEAFVPDTAGTVVPIAAGNTLNQGGATVNQDIRLESTGDLATDAQVVGLMLGTAGGVRSGIGGGAR